MQNISSQNLILNIDKPIGFSSAKIVAIVKKLTKAKKVGHFGTLDPFASGVLPIALNHATKASQYVILDEKKYSFCISWGQFRTTDDVEGEVEETSEKRPLREEIIKILPKFIGKIRQVPSKFSAIKINGQKSYDLVRQGVEFEMREREVEIYDLRLLNLNEEFGEFEVECGKGTYVRTLARDICKELGVCGYLSVLTRLKVGKFLHEQTISLDKLKNILTFSEPFVKPLGTFGDGLLSLSDVLDFMTKIVLDDLDVLKFRHGQKINYQKVNFNDKSFTNSSKETVQIIHNNQLIGLASLENGVLQPINVFN